MAKVKTMMNYMQELAPEFLALEWDNVGLMAGDENRTVTKVLTALELTDAVMDEAIRLGCELIVTHHPAIFRPIKAVNAATPLGRRLMKTLEHKIAVYSSHTNLDTANGGTNDVLFDLLGLKDRAFLTESAYEGYGMGRIGMLEKPVTLVEFAKQVKELLQLQTLTYIGDGGAMIKKVGLCTGAASGHQYVAAAEQAGCDVYITGDVRYHDAMDAQELHMNMIDGTHFATEAIVAGYLQSYLTDKLQQDNMEDVAVFASKDSKQPFQAV